MRCVPTVSPTLRALLVWGIVAVPAIAHSRPPAATSSRARRAPRPAAVPAHPPSPSPPHAGADMPATPASPRILPLSEVRPGMIGEALTVFQGTKPEAFKVRVISVMRQFLPKQDVILIRAEDPRLQFSGIVAGMSGSPVYVGGRLMGAIAYGWSFSKEPLGGVTPIETMLAERARPRRSSAALFTETDGEGLRVVTLAEGGPAATTRPAGEGRLVLDAAAPDPAAGAHLVRVAVPLSVSGFQPRVLDWLADELGGAGLVPVQGAGVGGGGAAGPHHRRDGHGHLEPGSAIGIELVRGDMSMVGTGTVTTVDRDGVLAFGHPMFGAGEIYLPLVEAEIHAILPSISQSMKLSSPLEEVGALVQDRQSCVVGDLRARATMVPITVRINGPGAPPRVFRAEVARNRRLTPTLVSLVISNALVDAEPDVADMTVKVNSTVGVKGHRPLELQDEIFAAEGVSRQSLIGTRGLRAIVDLLSNPFEPVILDRFDVDVTVEYGRNVAEIVAVSAPGGEIRRGRIVPLRVSLRPYDGAPYTETIPVSIPRTLAGDTARIEVAAGGLARPDSPPAESLATYLDNMRHAFAPTSIVVGLQTPDEGAALHGRLLPELPASAADTLRPGNQTRRAEGYRIVDRTIYPTTRLISGRQEIAVSIRDDALGAATP